MCIGSTTIINKKSDNADNADYKNNMSSSFSASSSVSAYSSYYNTNSIRSKSPSKTVTLMSPQNQGPFAVRQVFNHHFIFIDIIITIP